MKKYIVRLHAKATEANPSFAYDDVIYWYGKGDMLMGVTGKDAESHGFRGRSYVSKYMLNEYGYTRRCDALRNFMYKHPECNSFWETKADVVEVHI